MRHSANILTSTFILILLLMGIAGVSVEKCSCTGRITLTLPIHQDCCPDESDCMTVKSMQLSDYVPTTTASLEMPVQTALFPIFPPVVMGPTLAAEWQLESHCDQAPPGTLAHTVTVLRV